MTVLASGNLPPGVTDADIDRATWDEYEPLGECDCCLKMRPLTRCWAPGGIETYACDECREPPYQMRGRK